jgi:Fur family transcriptional regulator, ferric uptake regulator
MNSTRSFRMTERRRVILEELKGLTSHPTAEELHHLVRKRLPRISISTVYRSLEALCVAGLVWKMCLGESPTRFDATTSNHYHIRCDTCGRVDDVHMDLVPMIEDTAKKACGYESVFHRVEFTGVCPACAGNEAFQKRDKS